MRPAKLTWQRNGASFSLITVRWNIPYDAPAGQYRICHFGKWKSGWTGALSDYTGKSSVFVIDPRNCNEDYEGINKLTGLQVPDFNAATNQGIDSDQTIVNGTINYDAATSIELQPNFEVVIGAVFHAFIDGCN